MPKFNKKIIAISCFVSVLCLSFLPPFINKAEAQWAVWEMNPAVFVSATVSATANTTNTFGKEYGLDTIAWIIVNMVIEDVAASTINWINTGFRGSPAFIADPGQYFTNLADGIAGEVIYNNPNFSFMCAPFKFKVQIAINQTYGQRAQFQCTLSRVISNFDGFMNDFNQGGWDGFLEMTQNSQNNPIGLYNNWNDQLEIQLNSAAEQKQNELNQGNGFLSYKKCIVSAPATTMNTPGINGTVLNQDIPAQCFKYETVTPGSVIQTQLNNTLNSGNQRLQVADEFNEILSALLGQLTKRIIGGIGNGLRSLSQPGSGVRNPSGTFARELASSTLNDDASQAAIRQANANMAIQQQQLGTINGSTGITPPTNTCLQCRLVPAPATGGDAGVSISGGQCQPVSTTTMQICFGSAQTGGSGGGAGGGATGGGTGGTQTGGGATGGTTFGVIPVSNQAYTFPMAMIDGSSIVGRPIDLDCLNKDMSVIITQATALRNVNPNPQPGFTIADFVRTVDCQPKLKCPASSHPKK